MFLLVAVDEIKGSLHTVLEHQLANGELAVCEAFLTIGPGPSDNIDLRR